MPLHFVVESAMPDKIIERTIQLVLEVMTISIRPDRRQSLLRRSASRGLDVMCHQSVLNSFLRLVSSRQYESVDMADN